MFSLNLRQYLPKSLFGRALLILVFPIVLIQFTVGGIFADRIFKEMTGIMSENYVRVINQVVTDFSSAEDRAISVERAEALGLTIVDVSGLPNRDLRERGFFDLSGLYIERSLSQKVDGLKAIELDRGSPFGIYLWIEQNDRIIMVSFSRRFVSARNPHQLPVIMVFTSLLLTAVAVFFLRNQITPIQNLAEAADAFGQGRSIPLRPRGATEVRRATGAFLGMRSRIERHIDQRTLMLSGVSHDLRTPLTRLKLGVSMLDDAGADKDALRSDITDMENIIDEFLTFAGEDQDEGWDSMSPADFIEDVLARCRRSTKEDQTITFETELSRGAMVEWRSTAIQRAIENLVENALRYGQTVSVRLDQVGDSLRIAIEDDGPGIAPEDREKSTNAFVRLDTARNQNKGAGTGLGLAIAQDILRAHGGTLRLDQSAALGGLSVILILPLSRKSPGVKTGSGVFSSA
ncbi:MAG: ATP-binding protein [Pseudomonadota bacterium]